MPGSTAGGTPAATLSGHEHNYDDVRCAEFGLGPGARREHIPKWICDRRATQPQAKFGATLRAAVLFRPDFVARSSQTLKGMLVARASSGRKIPRRERHRSYAHDHYGHARTHERPAHRGNGRTPFAAALRPAPGHG